jgi:hypothetical protein
MAYTLNPRHLEIALASRSLMRKGERIELQRLDIGHLVVTSGGLAACDPLIYPLPEPFADAAVPAASYPVSIVVARFQNGDERVAYARLELDRAPATSWRMALIAGQDAADLGDAGYFGYGVDSGTGCFMDPVAARLHSARADKEPAYDNAIVEDMEKTYKPTWSWLNWRPSPERPENIVCFSSGWGDGVYPSFFGLSDEGSPTALVTDFLVLHGAE